MNGRPKRKMKKQKKKKMKVVHPRSHGGVDAQLAAYRSPSRKTGVMRDQQQWQLQSLTSKSKVKWSRPLATVA